MAVQIQDLVAYVVTSVVESGGALAKTKLVKLLYLMDVEYYKRVGQSLTGFRWRFYHYGPYDDEIDAVLKRLQLDIPQEQVLTKGGFTATAFRPPRFLQRAPDEFLISTQQRVVDLVLERWALEDLNLILDYVYFETAPMKSAKRGDLLDFSTIPPISPLAERPRLVRSPEREEKLKEFLKRTAQEKVKPVLTPFPRYDASYLAWERNKSEKASPLPKGEVDLDAEAKSHLGEHASQ